MVKAPFVRSPYNYDREKVSDETGLDCGTESNVKQSFAEECDINVIVRRFGLTGQLPEGVRPPTYGDFSDVGDFREAMQAVREATESFMAMPADVRARFGNDPALFVDFCSDPENLPEMRKLGLAVEALEQPAAGGATPPTGEAPKAASAAPAQ